MGCTHGTHTSSDGRRRERCLGLRGRGRRAFDIGLRLTNVIMGAFVVIGVWVGGVVLDVGLVVIGLIFVVLVDFSALLVGCGFSLVVVYQPST